MRINESKFRSIVRDEARRLYESKKRKKLKESALHRNISQEIRSLLGESWDDYDRPSASDLEDEKRDFPSSSRADYGFHGEFKKKYGSIENLDRILSRLASDHFDSRDYKKIKFDEFIENKNDALYQEMLNLADDDVDALGDDLETWFNDAAHEFENEFLRDMYEEDEDPYTSRGLSRSDFYPKPLPKRRYNESALHQIISQEITSLLREGWNPFANFSEKYKSINNFDDVINELANEYFVSEYTRGSFSDYVKDANDFLYDEMMEIAGDEATLQGDLDDWYTEMEGEIRSGHADSAAMSDPYKFHGVSRSDFYPKPLPKRRY